MRVRLKIIVFGVVRTVTQSMEKGVEELEIGERIATKQTELLRSPRILRKIQETWVDYGHSDSGEIPSTNAGEKN